jgi:flagellar M-ring protein FliF
VDKLKEFFKNVPARTLRTLAIIIGVTVAAIIAGVVALNLTNKTEYTTLFTGLSNEEAQQVGELLQDQNVGYRYTAGSGTILVPDDQVETLRVSLLSKGYPKSGFSYDMYINNSKMMSTESDKKQYTLYDLQDRLGATIRLFDGVQDAKVTIAEGKTSSYALDNTPQIDATASAVVTMQEGKTLSKTNADAIRNLIARSVEGMNFTNVSVFDAATMTEVSGSGDDGTSGISGSSEVNELEAEIASNIEGKIRKVLAQIYGAENIAVSVRGILDPTHSVQEATTYNVPEKIDDQDKEGLLKSEETSGETSGTQSGTGGNIAGTDANADTPDYTTDNGETTSDSYSNSSSDKEWLYNETTKQTETAPGSLTDVSVAVVINTDDTDSVSSKDLTNLVADAAGIAREDAGDKITIIRSAPQQAAAAPDNKTDTGTGIKMPSLIYLIAAGAAVVLLLMIILFIVTGRKRRKAKRKQEEEEAAEAEAEAERRRAEAAAQQKRKRQLSEEEKAGNVHIERGMKLKNDIGEFIDENPQVAAKLVESWLNEDDPNEKKQFR